MERGPASRLRAFRFLFLCAFAFAFAFPPTPRHACSEQNSAAQGRPCIRVPPHNGPRASCTGHTGHTGTGGGGGSHSASVIRRSVGTHAVLAEVGSRGLGLGLGLGLEGRLSRSLNGARRKTLDTGHRTQDARHRTQDTGHNTQDRRHGGPRIASHRGQGRTGISRIPAWGKAQAVVEPKPSDVCRRMRMRGGVSTGRERAAERPRLPAAVAGADAGCLGTSPFRTRTNGRRASRHGMGR